MPTGPVTRTSKLTTHQQTDEEARPAASKVLSKWRPEFIASHQPREVATGINGVQQQLTTHA